MGKIIAVTNQKGGVAKTTTSINLSAALVYSGYKVLLIDLDSQGNASVGVGLDKNQISNGTYHVLLGICKIRDAIMPSTSGIDVLAANEDLAGAQIELLEMDNRETRLKDELQEVVDLYDFIFIDCPPSLNILTINALAAAQTVIIPLQCEYYALEGLSALTSTIAKIKASLNPSLKIEGILRTMYDGRNSLAEEVTQQLKSYFANEVYHTFIPRNVRVAEAPGYGKNVIDYDRYSKGADAYLKFAGEFLVRNNSTSENNTNIKPTSNVINQG